MNGFSFSSLLDEMWEEEGVGMFLITKINFQEVGQKLDE